MQRKGLEADGPRRAGGAPQVGLPVTPAVLAIAHPDHDPANDRPRILAALCQRCHMPHDADEHRRTR